MALARVQRGSLVETVIAQLREAVETGTWALDERIPNESVLTERLGVGRNTIREAVRVLVHVGMLETRQGDGTYVRARSDPGETLRRIDRVDLHDQLEVRLTLEIEAARLAAARRDKDDLTAMQQALAAREAAGSDIAERIRHDARFHGAIVDAAHNRMLAELYQHFAAAIRRTIERTEKDSDLPEPTQADHTHLYDAIERGDGEAAALATRALLQPSLDTLSRHAAP